MPDIAAVTYPAYFVLATDYKPVRCDLDRWKQWRDSNAPGCAARTFIGPIEIHTVFNNVDHGFHPDEPFPFWYTMILSEEPVDGVNIYTYYQTLADAIKGHKTICRRIRRATTR